MTFGAHVLHDHVHGDLPRGDLREDGQGGSRPVGDPEHGDPGLVFHLGCTADGQIGGFRMGRDHGAGRVAETASHVDRHGKFLRKLDCPAVHYARPGAGQLEHLVVADSVQATSLGHDARVGRVDAVHVGVDFAGRCVEHGGQGHSRGVAAAAAQRGDVERLVDPLKPGSDHDSAGIQRRVQPVGRNGLDAGLGVAAVGHNADLSPRHADRFVPQRVDGHRHQGHGHLLAGREQHIHLPGRRFLGNLAG